MEVTVNRTRERPIIKDEGSMPVVGVRRQPTVKILLSRIVFHREASKNMTSYV